MENKLCPKCSGPLVKDGTAIFQYGNAGTLSGSARPKVDLWMCKNKECGFVEMWQLPGQV
jgi:hypothetical protein